MTIYKFHSNNFEWLVGAHWYERTKTPHELHQNSTKSRRMASKWNKNEIANICWSLGQFEQWLWRRSYALRPLAVCPLLSLCQIDVFPSRPVPPPPPLSVSLPHADIAVHVFSGVWCSEHKN